jgi:hypothetical protein
LSSNQPINFNDAVNKALQDNPHIVNSPGLASDVVKSSDPINTAPVLSHAAHISATVQAAQDYAAENPNPTHWWDGVVHSATKGLEVLVKPLQEVQRDYKYIHSLYTRHGIFTGLLGTLAVAGGATLGAFAGGGAGAVAGADFAAMGLRKIGGNLDEFRNSYADSENEKYKVSMGRDVANLFGAHGQTDTGWGKFVSGAVDAGFDVSLDPLMQLGALSKAVKAGDWVAQGGARVPWAVRSVGAQQFLESRSLKLFSADQLQSVYDAGLGASALSSSAGRQYHRALNELADLSAGDVVAKYPELQGLAVDLGRAKTAEEVHKAFMVGQFETEFMQKSALAGTALIPSRSIARGALSKASEKLRQPFANTLDDTVYDYRNAANFFIPRKGIDNLGQAKWIAPLAFRPLSKEAFASAVAKKVRTFSGYQPFVIDSGTLDLSTKTFDPSDPAALQGVYRVMRYSLGDKVARNVTGNYANAIASGDLGAARTIYVDGIHEMFKAAGLPNDSHLVEDLLDHMHMRGEGTISSQNYGHGFHTGDDVSMVSDADKSAPAALWSHQTGQWSYPDFRQVKLAVRSMGSVGKTYGTVDEFVAKNWTDSIFKPLALLTTGFGLRIAASELIPTFVRYGTIEVAKAKVAGAAAKMNYKIVAGEDEHIMSNAILALAGGGSLKDFLANEADAVAGKTVRKTIAKGLGKVANDDDLELASQIAIATKGHMASGSTMAGHGTDLDFAEKQKQLMHYLGQRVRAPKSVNPDGTFAQYSAHNNDFDIHWMLANQKASQNVAAQSIAQDVLRLVKSGKTQDEAWAEASKLEEARIVGVDPLTGALLDPANDLYTNERMMLSRYTAQDSSNFAFARTDDLRNTVTGGDGTFHEELLTKIANREKASLKELADIDSAAKPASVIGPELADYIGPNVMNRIIQGGFKKVIDPIVGGLSRQPLFFLHTKEAMRFYRPMIDAGKISEETGLRLAMTRASHAMLPQIHNIALRTQFSVLARNFLPFYFAQEQATKRYIKLAADNPEAFRAYQLVEHALNDPGFIQKDDQGNKFVTLPFVGEIGAGVMNAAAKLGLPVVGNLPITVRGDTSSLKTVLPEFNAPGTSPFVNIAANSLAALFPSLSRPVKTVIGSRGFSSSVIDSLIPSAPARAWFKALNANEQDSSFHSAMLSALAAANYHNQLPDENASPAEKQAFLDRIKNNARSILVIKGLLGTVSPLSPQVSQEDPKLRDEFYKLVQSKNDYPAALHEFLGKHGNDAISYTVARSEGIIKGATIPYTDQAINWLQDNEALLKSKHAVGAAFLVPQEPGLTGDKQAIYDEVLKMHLRQKRTPQEFMNSIYTSAGNNEYFSNKKIHDDAVVAAGDNKAQVDAENANWSEWVSNFKLMNPIWADDFQSPEKRSIATRAVADLQVLFQNGQAPKTEQSKLVYNLLQDYSKHEETKNIIRGYRVKTTLSDENANWDAYLNSLSQTEPRLTTIINGVFRRLP